MQVTINKRQMTVTKVEAINGALGADLQRRGFEAAWYTLTGPRGGSMLCLRSSKSGEFSKLF